MSAHIRVLLADDNAVIRQGVAALLGATGDIEVIAQAQTGREAVDLARAQRPDVILLDIRMPVMDGIEAARQLAADFRVMMLTYSEEEHLVTGAIQAGARGYLVHGRFEAPELERAVRDVAAGATALSPAVTPLVFDAVRRGPQAASLDQAGPGSLTAREREVMGLLVKGHSNRDIAQELFLTPKTVKNHLRNIYMKLGVSGRAEATALWLGVSDQPG